MKKNTILKQRIDKYQLDLKTKDRLLSSILKISSLLNRPIDSEKILHRLVWEMKHVFRLQRVVIFLINKREGTLDVKYVVGFSPPEVDRAFKYPLILETHVCRETLVAKTGKTMYIRNTQTSGPISLFDIKMDRIWKRTSSITVPLTIKGEIIGVINGDTTSEELILSKSDIKLFSSFASQASIIIENARLHEQAHKKIDQLMFLHSVSKKTSSTQNMDRLSDIITANAMKIAQAKTAFMLLVDDEHQHLKIAAIKGYNGIDPDHFNMQFGDNIAGWVATKGVPILINDVNEEPRYAEIIPGSASMVAIPLIFEDKVLGVLCVTSNQKYAFSMDDLELLMILGGHAAALINNIRLYRRVMTERNFTSSILESTPNAILTIDQNSRIAAINRKTEEIIGVPRKKILGKKIGEVFDGEMFDLLNKAVEDRQAIDLEEIGWQRKDGENFIFSVNTSLLTDKENRVQGTIVSIQDYTEIKKTEELMHRMDKLSSLGQLSAGMAHELRNPLACINFNVQLLAKNLQKDHNTQAILDDTGEAIERIKILVQRVLDFTKKGLPSFRLGYLYEAVAEAIELISMELKKKNIKINLNLSKELGPLIFDPIQMQQVFVNLLMNAMQASPESSTVEISGKIERRKNQGTDELVISIADQGHGISQQNLTKIFDPFFTTKPEGTGLGLSIVHKILDEHNAKIDVKSKPNKGTTFIMRFPMRQA